MTREEMWEEFESQLKREVRTPITMSYDDSIKIAEMGIEDVVKRWKKRLEQESCDDCISRENTLKAMIEQLDIRNEDYLLPAEATLYKVVKNMPPVTPQPKTGHWGRKTKVDAYDIAGVKTWGIKCQCDRCDFTTIVVEDFGYYKYCPNCGAKMESEE